MEGWLPIIIFAALGLGFAGINVVISQLVGPRKPSAEKMAPYECGMPPVGDARERHSIAFYLIAVSFLLFDVEIAFLYPYAMAVRDLGWHGFTLVLVFFVILFVGYLYEWRKGALDWVKDSVAHSPR